MLANVRYWSRVAPLVRIELQRWSARAMAIPDPCLRELAMVKLESEHFNAEVAATLATLAPSKHRGSVVEAIVALEVLYDYLDGLTERSDEDALRSGLDFYRDFTDALTGAGARDDCPALQNDQGDGGYRRELSATIRSAALRLPWRVGVLEVAADTLARCAEAQVRVHAAPQVGIGQLKEWAQRDSEGTSLQWREHLAGAVASVLGAHALIALASRGDLTVDQARATDTAYLSISALSTMLDGLVDYERDLSDGDPWLVDSYDDKRLLADRLAGLAADAVSQVRVLPDGPHHHMTLAGVVAYYASTPEARRTQTAVLLAPLRRELQPLLAPTLAVMRTWRLAKGLHRRGATEE